MDDGDGDGDYVTVLVVIVVYSAHKKSVRMGLTRRQTDPRIKQAIVRIWDQLSCGSVEVCNGYQFYCAE